MLGRRVSQQSFTQQLPAEWSIPCWFSHIFSGSYAGGYYVYAWADVLVALAMEQFKKEGFPFSKSGMRFRKEILSRGNDQDPTLLVNIFLGQPQGSKFSIAPYLRSLGLEALE